jgi:hypothetical protein
MPFRIAWNTLAELRDYALAGGCTPAQFNQAVEAIGDDPRDVAMYLQRYALHWQESIADVRERRAS